MVSRRERGLENPMEEVTLEGKLAVRAAVQSRRRPLGVTNCLGSAHILSLLPHPPPLTHLPFRVRYRFDLFLWRNLNNAKPSKKEAMTASSAGTFRIEVSVVTPSSLISSWIRVAGP